MELDQAAIDDGLDADQRRRNAAAAELLALPEVRLQMANDSVAMLFHEVRRLRGAMRSAIENGAADEMREILTEALEPSRPAAGTVVTTGA